MMNIFIKRTDSGYTLLFAMIVASIVLAIGVSLLTISRKEFDLSSSATQSSNAFYAADSGIGCAEYWNDNNEFDMSAGSPSDIYCSLDGTPITVNVCYTGQPQCSDNSITPPPSTLDDLTHVAYEFTFYVPFSTDGTSNQSCAAVDVKKYSYTDHDLGNAEHIYTDITSAGYNIGYNPRDSANNNISDCSSPSPKKVNRTIELTY
jgi:Tfp pilus assembly protein PilX